MYDEHVLRGQDIVVLLALAGEGVPRPPLPALASRLALSVATLHRALERLRDARLADPSGMRVNALAAQEFLLHGVRYVFPAHLGPESRGVPTAWGAAALRAHLADAPGAPPVWPDPEGDVRGPSVVPLHPVVPMLAANEPLMGSRLALVDALRLGDARMRGLAGELLVESIRAGGALSRVPVPVPVADDG